MARPKNETVAKYHKEHFKSYDVSFRFDTDEALIDYMQEHADIGTTEILRRALEYYMNEEQHK